MSDLVTEFFWLPDGGTRGGADSMSGEIHGTLGMLDVQQQDASIIQLHCARDA